MSPKPMTLDASQSHQNGAISLLVAISLGLLASLASFYSARSVLIDRLASHNQSQATQARLAAEAALAWARAELLRQYTGSLELSVWDSGLAAATCPSAYNGPRWQCVTLQPPAHPGLPDAAAQVLAVRDLIRSPHVAQLHASASLKDSASRAQVQAQVFLPTVAPAPTQRDTAAVVLNLHKACEKQAWTRVLGDIKPEQIRAWSEAQVRNGLHSLSQPTRSIYWVDSPSTWTQSLGSREAPVLLVFSSQACAYRCPDLAPGVRVLGTVVLQTQCQHDKARAWYAGYIEGQLVVESDLPDLHTGSRIEARALPEAYRLVWPAGIDAGQVQRVPGSWREGGP